MAEPSSRGELGVNDLFELELMIRTEAEQLRKDWPKSMIIDPTTTAGMRLYAEKMNNQANRLHRVGDLLKGLQGSWPQTGPLVRRGYQKMVADYNKMMAEAPKKTEDDAA